MVGAGDLAMTRSFEFGAAGDGLYLLKSIFKK